MHAFTKVSLKDAARRRTTAVAAFAFLSLICKKRIAMNSCYRRYYWKILWLPCELGSGKFSRGTKCITVVFPHGNPNAPNVTLLCKNLPWYISLSISALETDSWHQSKTAKDRKHLLCMPIKMYIKSHPNLWVFYDKLSLDYWELIKILS